MGHRRHKPAPTRFIVLIGGPGIFQACDREHDQTWRNYIVPVQLAFQSNQVELAEGEQAEWWVYAPAYRERWADDNAAVKDAKLDKGRNLIESRQKAIDSVLSKHSKDYLDRIETMASSVKASFVALEKPDDFWNGLKALPDKSVSRIWYIGHARNDALMLKLIHFDRDGTRCIAGGDPTDEIPVSDIAKWSGTIAKKLTSNGKDSRFYGCHTKAFAEQWNSVFGMATDGAVNKIDFGVTDRASDKPILPRLETSNPDTNWTTFPAKKAAGSGG